MNHQYSFFTKAVVRTPIKSIDELYSFIGLIKDKDQVIVLNILKEYFENNEGLYLASPSLFYALEKTKFPSNNSPEKIIYSLLKYFIRMSTRSTPFGLFSGCNATELKCSKKSLIETNGFIRHTRFDGEFLFNICTWLDQQISLRKHLTYTVNNSVYFFGDQFRYIEKILKDNKLEFKTSALEHTEIIQKIFSNFKNSFSYQQLETFINYEGEFDDNEIFIFINELISSQFLISGFNFSLCGEEWFPQLISYIRELNIPNDTILDNGKKWIDLKDFFNEINATVIDIDSDKIHNPIENYLSIKEKLHCLTGIDASKLVQVDSGSKINNFFLKESLKEEILELTEVLQIFNQTDIDENRTLSKFKQTFIERFGEQQIPLITLMDPEWGIGYPVNKKNPIPKPNLINHIANLKDETSETVISTDRIFDYLLRKYQTLNENVGNFEIEFHEKEIKNLLVGSKKRELPGSASCLIKLAKLEGSEEEIVFLKGFFGTSGINLISRFGHLSEDIFAVISEIDEYENSFYKNKIIAEINHLADVNAINILQRPSIRKAEINYLSGENKETLCPIPIDDILISVKNNKIVLISKSQNKEIITRLSNAHNFKNNCLPLYEFLCDIQSEDELLHLSFSWKNLEKLFKHLPRVRYKNIVLSLETWYLKKEDLTELLSQKYNQAIFTSWREKYRIPNKVFIVEGDNELYIDFLIENFCLLFLNEIKDKDNLILIENFESNNDTVTKNRLKKNYFSELILFIKNENIKSDISTVDINNLHSMDVQRYFIPGDEWIYYKLYIGVSQSDYVLMHIGDLIAENQSIIKKWFFIRYEDDKPHLRIRFSYHEISLEHRREFEIKFYLLLNDWFSRKKIIDVRIDTYNRELERYGKQNIEISESIFFLESQFIVEYFKYRAKDFEIDNKNLFFISIKYVDFLLSFFDIANNDKIEITQIVIDSFKIEFGVTKQEKTKLYQKLKEIEFEYFNILNSLEIPLEFQLLSDFINSISNELYKVKNNLRGDLEEKIFLTNYILNHIHMFVNRLYCDHQRIHEMAIYQGLNVFYSYKKHLFRV